MGKNQSKAGQPKRRPQKKPVSAYFAPWGSIGTDSVTLTGSAHLFAVQYDDGSEFRILVDCGIYQGPGSSEANRKPFPMEPSKIHTAILTHGHADHCGRYPVFVKNGYPGQISCSNLTTRVATESLKDAAKLTLSQYELEQASYLKEITRVKEAFRTVAESRKNGIRRNPGGCRMEQTGAAARPSKDEVAEAETLLVKYGIETGADIARIFEAKRPVEPLFLPEDAEAAIARFRETPMGMWQQLHGAPGVSFFLFDACHVLGSTSVAIRVHGIGEGREKSKTFVISGDIGPTRAFQPHGTPEIPENLHPDLIAVESTYGGRRHPEWECVLEILEATVKDAERKRDVLVVPAFALDRAQLVTHLLVSLKQKGAFTGEIYLDSPLSATYSRLYQKNVPEYAKTLKPGPKTFKVLDKNGREAVLSKPGFKIVVTSSGMGMGGPVVDYFRRYLENSRAEFLFAGYMAEGTPGRALTEGKKLVSIPEAGGEFEVRAKIGRLDGLSSHADEVMVREWCGVGNPEGTGKPKLRFPKARVALIHGEKDGSILSMKHAFERRLFPMKQLHTPDVDEKIYL